VITHKVHYFTFIDVQLILLHPYIFIKTDKRLRSKVLYIEVVYLIPAFVLQEMFPLLQRSVAHKTTETDVFRTTVLNLSSLGASMGKMRVENPDKWLQGLGYRTSKAALNMAMRMIACTMKDSGVLMVNLCPGWVKTDMGSNAADLEVSESVSAIFKTLSQLNDSHHGAFIDRNGKTIPF
ncbi:unnamed protein product, partial [Larinioides sclopetarius]